MMKSVLIVEPELHGHKAFYLSLILKALKGNSITVLTQKSHPSLTEHLKIQNISEDDFAVVPVHIKKVTEVFQQASQLSNTNKFDQIFIPYLDHYLGLILNAPDALKGKVSGIWFHPYALDQLYRWIPPLDKRTKTRSRLHRKLRDLKASRNLERIYFLDPEAPHRLSKINPRIQSTVLPDPGERSPRMTMNEARAHFKLPKDKTIFLHVGSPEKRKGLPDALKAFENLIRVPEQRQRVFLLRIGPNDRLPLQDQIRIKNLINAGCAKVVDHFVSAEDFIEYFSAANCILIPYRNFRFSSGILANATLAQRPVIASNYGMIGSQVTKNNLGQCFAHKSISQLENCLKQWPIEHSLTKENADQNSFIQKIRELI